MHFYAVKIGLYQCGDFRKNSIGDCPLGHIGTTLHDRYYTIFAVNISHLPFSFKSLMTLNITLG